MADVADLLRQSRAANAAFHVANQASQERASQRAAIQHALTLRLEADLADPHHTDPAWQDDQAPHADIVTFYQQYLASHP